MAEKPDAPGQVISLPKGGGAIKGIGETFQPNLFTGTGNFTVPIYTSPGRGGFGPKLSLEYSTGNGNGIFGLGWQLSVPQIARKTERGLPRYDERDVFVMSGSEDLVPCLKSSVDAVTGATTWLPEKPITRGDYSVTRYRPRTEGLFARIEQWVDTNGDIHWRATTKDNITSIYGKTQAARVVNPDYPQHVFEWLLQETFDARGNHILYEYAYEDPAVLPDSISERHHRYAQCYIRRIFYGNSYEPVGPKKHGTDHRDPLKTIERRYCFEVLFDYGDLKDDYTLDNIEEQELTTAQWRIRPDPFSTYRAGFEIRTLRCCERVIMLHHFAEVGNATCVKSTDFQYHINPDTLISLLVAATLTGYKREGNTYRSASLPPATFTYSEFKPQQQHYQSIAARGNHLPPLALHNPDVALVDLFGRGVPDLLHTTTDGFRYWKNIGNGTFDQPRLMPRAPAGVILSQPEVSFADLAGDGHLELLVVNDGQSGFYETTSDGAWTPFQPVLSRPSFSLSDPNTRLVDLTGNGLTDVLVTRERQFLWFECLGEEGYAHPQVVNRMYDLDEFPDIYFGDGAGRIRLADMNGDGLQDIVMIHNSRIDYWPNLGYGRFGKRITMGDAPRLEQDFDPTRLFLADLDGSGCADLVYVDYNTVRFWFNRSGNSWSSEQVIQGTPVVSSTVAVQFADFLGTGTTALIWSYDFNNQPESNYKVLDFCGGIKPYLLVEMDNHMGATTRVEYATSTRFYLDDEEAGDPWVTRLPFPVQVVKKVEAIDHVSRTKLVTIYKYHHGYFDGSEREFRGFGRVDRFDTEYLNYFAAPGLYDDSVPFDNAASEYYLPPIETRTWFHIGIYFDKNTPGQVFDFDDLDQAYRQSYYRGDQQAFTLDSHNVETGSVPHEGYRALRGAILRTEVYAHDGTMKAKHPYQVTENRYQVHLLQPNGNNHAVYHTTTLESLTSDYERQPSDPRVQHVLNLRVDKFGNITDSVTVAYPRRVLPMNLPEQGETKLLYTHSDFINTIGVGQYYYVSHPYQTRVYEITGLLHQRYRLTDFDTVIADPDDFVAYHFSPTLNAPQKRIIDWTRTYYSSDAQPDVLDQTTRLDHRLGLGVIESLGLPYETYRAALTDDLITGAYGTDSVGNTRVTLDMLREGGYVAEPDITNIWWIPGGRTAYNEDGFYLSIRSQDAFGNISQTVYDRYDLLVEQVVDPLSNTFRAANDYRVLQLWQLTDPNRNRTAVAFNALGMMVATAVMSKAGENRGDLLEDFDTDLLLSDLQAFIADPQARASSLLGKATTRIIYDLECFHRAGQPPFASKLVRETHFHDPGGDQTKIQISFSYFDGFGREIQKKIQAEAGNAPQRQAPLPLPTGDIRPGDLVCGAQGKPVQANMPRRWVGSGRMVFNNKGKPVRQYEPFFSATHLYEAEREMTDAGVSPVLFYDPVERVVATLHPNHTYEKVVFDPWQQMTYDVNDNVAVSGTQTGDPRTDPDIAGYVREYFKTQPATWQTWHTQHIGNPVSDPERDAAQKAAAHADTPTAAYLDALGRPFLTIEHNRYKRNGAVIEEKNATRIELDLEGNQRAIREERKNPDGTLEQRIVMRYDYDMLGNRVHQSSMEAGERWMLNDVTGKPIRAWDSRRFLRRMTYDELRRPTGLFVTENGAERLAERTVYGESQGDTSNHRTRVHQLFDGAGIVTSVAYDFKGNLLESRRDLLPTYRQAVNWQLNPAANDGSFTSSTTYDALNRPLTAISPDDSIYRPTFNEANLLDKVDMNLRGTMVTVPFVTNIDYNAKGQRELIAYGNGALTTYEYDPLTFRLTHLKTIRPTNPDATASQLFQNATVVQDLYYTYDPVGNLTRIEDAALKVVFHNGQQVDPVGNYIYDALYRLIEAQGREHIGQNAFDFNPSGSNYRDYPFTGNRAHPNDLQMLRNYTQHYEYDAVGNFEILGHIANGGGWTQRYVYDEDSLIEANKKNNQLTRTTVGNGINQIEPYTHDTHGNMTTMPLLAAMVWDFEDQLQQVDTRGGGTGYYVYNAGGQRVRKVIDSQNGTRQKECTYLGGFEIYREFSGNGIAVTLERETLHVMDDKQRIALVETQTIENGNLINDTVPLRRYQFGNHLGSTSVELDRDGALISYEEYHPYGTTAFQAGRSAAEVSLKRYRFTGKERDDETGFSYHGARYYAPWLGRWTSCDPEGMVDGPSVFVYSRNNPLRLVDPSGRESIKPDETETKHRSHVIILSGNMPGRQGSESGNADKWLGILLNETTVERFSERVEPGDELLIALSPAIGKEERKAIDAVVTKFQSRFLDPETGKSNITLTVKTVKAGNLAKEVNALDNISTLIYLGHGTSFFGPLYGGGGRFPDPKDFRASKFASDCVALFASCNLADYAKQFTQQTGVTSLGVEGTTWFGSKTISAGVLPESVVPGTSKLWKFERGDSGTTRSGPYSINSRGIPIFQRREKQLSRDPFEPMWPYVYELAPYERSKTPKKERASPARR